MGKTTEISWCDSTFNYGVPSTQLNWEYTREHWLRDDSIAWLKEKSKRPMSEFVK